MNRTVIALLVIGITSPGVVMAQPLIGDPVPALADEVLWAIGEPVPQFDDGKVYVLDFWATWCPPCYPLMDHLSEIQDRYDEDGLVVIGIAVGTDVGMSLETFLDKEAHRISYAIAEPKDENRLKSLLVHPSIMKLEDFGLPFVMIIDRQGRLAWVNDPYGADDQLDQKLAAIVDGSYDLESSSSAAKQEQKLLMQFEPKIEQVHRLRDEGRFQEATEVLLPVVDRFPHSYSTEAVALYEQILCSADEMLAATYGRRLLNGPLQDRVSSLVQLERAILSLPVSGSRDLELAEATARRALELKGGNHPDFLFELAKVLAAQGEMDQAETYRQKATSVLKKEDWDVNYLRYISSIDLNVALSQQARNFSSSCQNRGETQG